jgi:hypothetical protein
MSITPTQRDNRVLAPYGSAALIASVLMTGVGVALALGFPGGPLGWSLGGIVALLFGFWAISGLAEIFRPKARLVVNASGFQTQNQRLILWEDIVEIRESQPHQLRYVLPSLTFIGVMLRDRRAWIAGRDLRGKFDSWLWRRICHVDIGIPTVGLGSQSSEVMRTMLEQWHSDRST